MSHHFYWTCSLIASGHDITLSHPTSCTTFLHIVSILNLLFILFFGAVHRISYSYYVSLSPLLSLEVFNTVCLLVCLFVCLSNLVLAVTIIILFKVMCVSIIPSIYCSENSCFHCCKEYDTIKMNSFPIRVTIIIALQWNLEHGVKSRGLVLHLACAFDIVCYTTIDLHFRRIIAIP